MKYSVPGKTFLVGEYAVLVGGSALGLATTPCFEIEYQNDLNAIDNLKNLFHKKSPAGRFIEESLNLLSIQSLNFYDPYKELEIQGGFGRSTAEYLAVIIPHLLKNKFEFSEIRNQYRNLYYDEEVKPSGIDLAIQYFGGVCLAQPLLNKYESINWSFSELDFFIISTGYKVQTHQHLEELNLKKLEKLIPLSDSVIESYLKKDESDFIRKLSNWCLELESLDLTSLKTLQLKKNIEENKNILLVKPCGALGADVVLVFFKKNNTTQVREFIQKHQLKIVAQAKDICSGVIKYVG